MRRLVRSAAAAAAATVLAVASGCSSGQGDSPDQQLTVLAAASLTESFGELAKRFEDEHPGVDVVTSFDSSATIAAQVVQGAPADVVATADPRTMQTMQDADVLAGDPVVFAHNELVLVVPPDNPAGIEDLGDLQDSDYVVCAPEAPCGHLAKELLDREGITKRPRSLEVDVKAVLTKVELGEADAGLVYYSDLVAAGDRVDEIPLPGSVRVATDYPMAITVDSRHPDLAQEWIDLVRSRAGQWTLSTSGFGTDSATSSDQ